MMKLKIISLIFLLIFGISSLVMGDEDWYNILQSPGDVDKTAPSEDQALVWDSILELWVSEDIITETGGDSRYLNLSGLNADQDIDIGAYDFTATDLTLRGEASITGITPTLRFVTTFGNDYHLYAGAEGYFILADDDTGWQVFRVEGNDSLSLVPDFGKVGIGLGVTPPGYLLDVGGTGRFSELLRLDGTYNSNTGIYEIIALSQSDIAIIPPTDSNANLYLLGEIGKDVRFNLFANVGPTGGGSWTPSLQWGTRYADGETDFTSSSPLRFQTSADTDDYLLFRTVADIPEIHAVGADLKITADGGAIDFDDENLSTLGTGILGDILIGDVRLSQPIAGFFTVRTDSPGTDTTLQSRGRGTGSGKAQFRSGGSQVIWELLAANSGTAAIDVAGSAPVKFAFISAGNVPVRYFDGSANGVTQAIRQYGFKAGESLKYTEKIVGTPNAESVTFAGSTTEFFFGDAARSSMLVVKGSSANGILRVGDTADGVDLRGINGFGQIQGSDVGSVAYNGLKLFTSATPAMTILTDNNVGIGTVTPTAALQMGDDKLIALDTNAGLIASTTQDQGEGALTAQINEISTVANNGDTVTLPPAVTGVEIEIIHNGAETLRIFPASGDDLGLGTGALTSFEELEANERVKFVAYDTTNWAKESTTEIIHAEIHDEDNTDAFVINDFPDFHSYHTNGLAAGDLADWAFDAGGAGTSHVIDSIADGVDSGNDIEVTTADNHLLEDGDIVSQTGLDDANYVGIFVVKDIISVTQYEVAAPFDLTGTGTMDQAATLEADAVAAGVYAFAYYISASPVNPNETFDFQLYKEATAVIGSKIRRKFGSGGDFGSMSGGGVVTVADGEKISFALSNENSAANLTVRNLTIVLIRL